MLFGYEQGERPVLLDISYAKLILSGVFGGIIVGQDFIEYFNHPSPAMQGFVTSVYDLGCFVGAVSNIIPHQSSS